MGDRNHIPTSQRFNLVLLLSTLLISGAAAHHHSLPLPQERIALMPPLVPAVVTSGGQRRLLSEVQVRVQYDPHLHVLRVEPEDWWLINYPLEQIEGFDGRTLDEISRLLFKRSAGEVRNWYFKTPGAPAPEPPPAIRPAHVRPAADHDLIVDAAHPSADDNNAGTPERPLRTIQAAVDRARPGNVIHIRPGIYRESIRVRSGGTPDRPVSIEGLPDADGGLPVISGNDPFPPGAWSPAEGLPGVWRAELFTRLPGTVSADGNTLIERDHPGELRQGEHCFNRGSLEFLNLRVDPAHPPRLDQEEFGRRWRRHQTDDDGFLDLRAIFGNEAHQAVIWISTWVWLTPPADPEDHRPPAYRVRVEDGFRAARQTGTDLDQQVNPYRVWVNGTAVPAFTYAAGTDIPGPRAARNWGTSDEWLDFPLRHGWNHLLLQLDTTVRPDNCRFRLSLRQQEPAIISSASAPTQTEPPQAAPRHWCTEYLVLDPFPAPQADKAVYIRLPDDADPNDVVMDLSRRGTLLDIVADFVEVRGLEFRHGAQFQQRAQVLLDGQGILLEGCIIRDSEVRGITINPQRDQLAAPIVIRNNWIVNPGNTGIGGSGSSDRLTSANQNDLAPGRTSVLIEHNTIINANWTGIEPLWESGGIKLFRLTGSVIRYNTILGAYGPGIWLDWEHYANRIEGNRIVNAWGFGVGVEASPGPNLVANNLCIGLRPGPVWFRGGVLSWDSSRTCMIHNTIDGRFNSTQGWHDYIGTEGLRRGYRADRPTRWSPMPHMDLQYALNLVLGCRRPIGHDPDDTVLWNYSDVPTPATDPLPEGRLQDPQDGDYRPVNRFADVPPAADIAPAAHVRHDFFGLLRFPDQPAEPGAFRHEPASHADALTIIEVEYEDGSMRRRHLTGPD